MIIDFTVRNYLSIKDEVTLSFLSNSKIKDDELKTISVENGRFNLYSFSAIYGPNASGKSNLIKAFSDFINIILLSHRLDLDQPIPSYKPYRLEKENLSLPIGFEMEFIVEKIRYLYKIDFIRKEIINEELYFFPEGRKANLFKRHKSDPVEYGSYFKGKKKYLENILLQNRLLLSVVSNTTNEQLKPVFRFFRDMIDIHVSMDSSRFNYHSTTSALRNHGKEFSTLLLKILRSADLSLNDIKIEEDDKLNEDLTLPEGLPEDIRKEIVDQLKYKPYFGHTIYDKGKATEDLEYFDLENQESTGTIKMYDIAGEVIKSLQTGSVLIIDEFNSGLHPILNKFLVQLFIDPKINRMGAQLLISTHDTCVLDLKVLKREQIWFTEKSKYGSTELFSLDEFDKNSIRDNAKYAKLYLDGRFNAVPAPNANELVNGLF